MVYTEVPQNWSTPSTSKNTNLVGTIPFVGNLYFSSFYKQGAVPQKLFVSPRYES